jgi:hypothetical protein
MTASQELTVNWKNVPTRTITADGAEFAYRELGTNNPLKERSQNRDKEITVTALHPDLQARPYERHLRCKNQDLIPSVPRARPSAQGRS